MADSKVQGEVQVKSPILARNGWVSINEAVRRSGLSHYRIEKMMNLGAVARFMTPGSKPQICWADVERIVAEAGRPDRAAGSGSSGESTTV